jgi:hypothetical protein
MVQTACCFRKTPALRESPLILFYNQPFPGQDPTRTDCGNACEFTFDRRRLIEAAAVIFHIPTLRGMRLPAKLPRQRWVAWSMESEVNYPELADPVFMRQFEVTMTYRRDATVWFPYFDAETATALLSPPRPKNEASPVVYFRSSPIDRCGRTEYAAELMRHVKIDSYGRLLHNRDLPEADKGRETMIPVTARYKFALALENSIAEDYVTEKFFCALIAGSVPVYRGAPNVGAFAPAAHSFIDAADFAGPVELAAYLNWLNENSEAYERYLSWKRTGLSPGFQALVASLRDPPLCRLCALMRRSVPQSQPCGWLPGTIPAERDRPIRDVSRLDESTWYPKAVEGLETHEVAAGYIIYQPDRDRVHYLNQTAAILFALCTGENCVTEMPELLRAAFGLASPPAAETRDCLKALIGKNLIY